MEFWSVSYRKYSPGDAFVGYHGDTAASVVLQVCSNMDQHGQRSDRHSWEEEVRQTDFINY